MIYDDFEQYFLSKISPFSTPENNSKMKRALSQSFNDRKINIVSVFCPSYKKDSIGYNCEIGKNTLRNIENLKTISSICSRFRIDLSIIIFYGDIFIENLDELCMNNIDYRKQLNDNFKNLNENLVNANLDFKLYKLSDKINESSLPISVLDCRKKIIIEKRNFSFYSKVMDWDAAKIERRNKDLHTLYCLIKDLIAADFSDHIIYWSESILERSLYFDDLSQPIFFINNTTLDNQHIPAFEDFDTFKYYQAGGFEYIDLDGIIAFKINDSIVMSASDYIKNPSIIDRIPKNSRIEIRYFREQQALKFKNSLTSRGFTATIRSPNEAIYDVHALINLEGSKFKKVRSEKRSCSKVNFSYRKISKTNIDDAIFILTQWRKTRSHIYSNNRLNREIALVKYLASKKKINTRGLIQYYNEKPTGIIIVSKNGGCLINVICKGLNDIHKLSSGDLYFKLIEIANKRNCRWINDGDLGTEKGSIRHKLKYKPYFVRTFDFIRSNNE